MVEPQSLAPLRRNPALATAPSPTTARNPPPRGRVRLPRSGWYQPVRPRQAGSATPGLLPVLAVARDAESTPAGRRRLHLSDGPRCAVRSPRPLHSPAPEPPPRPRTTDPKGHTVSRQSDSGSRQEPPGSRPISFDTALRIATIMAEANQRLFKLQSEAVNAALAENAKQLKSLLRAQDSTAVVAEWAGRYQANARKILEVTRQSFEIVPQTQTEMAKLLGRPFAPYHEQTRQCLDEFATAIAEGCDAAEAAVQEVLAAASAQAGAVPSAVPAKVA